MSHRKFYQIMQTNTGLFSTGTNLPRFAEEGKIWNSLNEVKLHLSQIMDLEIYQGADVIELRVNHFHVCPAMNYVYQFAGRRLLKTGSPFKNYKPLLMKNKLDEKINENSNFEKKELKKELNTLPVADKMYIKVYRPWNK